MNTKLSKITWVLSEPRIDNFCYHMMLELLERDENLNFQLVIDENLEPSESMIFPSYIHTIDRRLKMYKESAFKKIDISNIIHDRVSRAIDFKDIQNSDWIIFSGIKKLNATNFTGFSKNGYLLIERDQQHVVHETLRHSKAISLRFNWMPTGTDVWQTITNMQINLEKGVINSCEKYHWLLTSAIVKFLTKPSQFERIDNLKQTILKINYLRLLSYYIPVIINIIQRKILKYNYNWKIAFQKEGSSPLFLSQPNGSFWADPFFLTEDNIHYLFIEELNQQTGKGEIACLFLDDQFVILEKHTIFQNTTHFSFPNIFKKEGKYYMIPENSESNQLNIYEALDFPLKWKLKQTLFDNVKLIDAVWIQHEGYYWIFANKINRYEYDNNDCLYLYYSEDLFSDKWTPHPQNPIITDSCKARNAGNVYKKGEHLYRPSQDCSQSYGARIVINEITILTKDQYEEREIDFILPFSDCVGVHTVNEQNDIKVYDFLKRERIN